MRGDLRDREVGRGATKADEGVGALARGRASRGRPKIRLQRVHTLQQAMIIMRGGFSTFSPHELVGR